MKENRILYGLICFIGFILCGCWATFQTAETLKPGEQSAVLQILSIGRTTEKEKPYEISSSTNTAYSTLAFYYRYGLMNRVDVGLLFSPFYGFMLGAPELILFPFGGDLKIQIIKENNKFPSLALNWGFMIVDHEDIVNNLDDIGRFRFNQNQKMIISKKVSSKSTLYGGYGQWADPKYSELFFGWKRDYSKGRSIYLSCTHLLLNSMDVSTIDFGYSNTWAPKKRVYDYEFAEKATTRIIFTEFLYSLTGPLALLMAETESMESHRGYSMLYLMALPAAPSIGTYIAGDEYHQGGKFISALWGQIIGMAAVYYNESTKWDESSGLKIWMGGVIGSIITYNLSKPKAGTMMNAGIIDPKVQISKNSFDDNMMVNLQIAKTRF